MKTKRKKTRLNPEHGWLENSSFGHIRKPRLAYGLKVWLMTDEQMYVQTEQMIWLSAFAANNPRSDYHWKVDFLYAECVRRGREDLYQKAWEHASGTA